MKTKILTGILILFGVFLNAQSKVDSDKEKLKFYFPVKAFADDALYKSNIQKLTSQVAPYEIDEKAKNYTEDAPVIYLQQKNYKGLIDFSSHEKFPKYDMPLKSYSVAMIADAAKGEKFKKTFADDFQKEFSKLDESNKTMIAGSFFDDKMITEFQKMITDFNEKLVTKKSDTLSYKDAKNLLLYDIMQQTAMEILPLGKNIVKGYVPEYFQPFITGNLFMSMVKPKEVTVVPDVSKERKLLFELIDLSYKFDKETAFKRENNFLLETGRIMNLTVGSGFSPEKLKVAIVVHGGAIDILLNNENYQKKYKTDNPNIPLIKQMQSKGVQFVVCGQQMSWTGGRLADFTEGIKEAFSAKTAIRDFQSQGYILEKLEAEGD